MKAWLLDDLTGIDGLRLTEVPDPVPGAGEVILEVHFAALNPADRYLAERQYPAKPPLPHILGRDGIGSVLEVGSGSVCSARGTGAQSCGVKSGLTARALSRSASPCR